MIGVIVSKVYCDYYIGTWSNMPPEDQQKMYWHFVLISFTFAVVSSVCINLGTLSLTYYCWQGNRCLQEDMIKRVLNAPVNLYFDTTPLGRILNRFSKDLSVAETVMPWSIANFYAAFYGLMAVLALSVLDSPYLILLFPVLSIIIIFYFK